MKCPYRKERVTYKDVFNGSGKEYSNDTHEYFMECYGDDCPLFVDGKCVKVEREKYAARPIPVFCEMEPRGEDDEK